MSYIGLGMDMLLTVIVILLSVAVFLGIIVFLGVIIKVTGWTNTCKGLTFIIIGVATIAGILTVMGMIGTSYGLTSENMRDGYRSIFGLSPIREVKV